ncbi:hypothetical protein [Symbiopectobacterium purcellii]|uniref:hypothetical protein n=1 Tax=Symbiopectobacterium purcellii TaxID=2871826 RepID=UPI003F867152
MQQALQYGQNGDFIRLWQVGHFVAFRVGMGPVPLEIAGVARHERNARVSALLEWVGLSKLVAE